MLVLSTCSLSPEAFSRCNQGTLSVFGTMRLVYDFDIEVFSMRAHTSFMLLEAITSLTNGRTDACGVPDDDVCEKICAGSS